MKNLILFFRRIFMSLYQLKIHLAIIFLGISACTYDQLEEPNLCDSSLTLVVNQVKSADCGLATGSISISATGGEGALSFQINNQALQSTGDFKNLPSGTYEVRVVDENQCFDIQTVDVTNANGINIELSSQTAGCGGSQGSIAVQASGGLEPYEFSINGGNFQTGNSFAGLETGSYTIEGMDANGCQITKTIDITSGISLQNDIRPIIDQNCAVPTCHGGSQSPDFRQVNNIINSASRIKTRTGNRSMPRGGRTLSQQQIDMIACWVDDGALDN